MLYTVVYTYVHLFTVLTFSISVNLHGYGDKNYVNKNKIVFVLLNNENVINTRFSAQNVHLPNGKAHTWSGQALISNAVYIKLCVYTLMWVDEIQMIPYS